MRAKHFNVLLDLQWGSCGKGKFAPFLADNYDVRHVSCSHRPNAGHTVQIQDITCVLKCLPSAVTLQDRPLGHNMSCYLSAGASFRIAQLDAEMALYKPYILSRHPRAMAVTEAHCEQEMRNLVHIASTMQGAGAALQDKLSRRVVGLSGSSSGWLDVVHEAVRHTMLHEAAQGWELSIDHGYKYPFVTSRNCGTAAALDEMGVSPRSLGDVYGVFRPYPIRVGNLGEHSSGSTPGLETSWPQVLLSAGAPPEVIEAHIQKHEYTTVTKRRRRVFDIDFASLARAVRSNSVTHLVLNFVQYLDWELCGERGHRTEASLPLATREFITNVERACGVPVCYLGTGPEHSEVITLC